jgi:hypothetical protein
MIKRSNVIEVTLSVIFLKKALTYRGSRYRDSNDTMANLSKKTHPKTTV